MVEENGAAVGLGLAALAVGIGVAYHYVCKRAAQSRSVPATP